MQTGRLSSATGQLLELERIMSKNKREGKVILSLTEKRTYSKSAKKQIFHHGSVEH